MRETHTKSTSRSSAQADDVKLRVTDGVRLVFRPTIVDNPTTPDASVRGTFLYQRKRRSSDWEDFETIPLTSVKSGEGYKLDLKSEEILELVQAVQSLHNLKQQYGVPYGQKRFVQLSPQLRQLSQLSEDDIRTLLDANVSLGSALLSKLVAWSASQQSQSLLLEQLLALDSSKLQELNVAIGLNRIRSALQEWEKNRDNSNEGMWQKHIAEHSFVLEHIFSWPASVVCGKAYVGGKTVHNKGGNVVDFMLRNRLTQSAALVEIKTPTSKLLGSAYRQTYNVGTELSGAVMQVLNYKHSLQQNYQSLTRGGKDLFDVFDPPCAVIIGDTAQLNSTERAKAFELFRSQVPGVRIVTFDEVFDRARNLISLLEGNANHVTIESHDDLPF